LLARQSAGSPLKACHLTLLGGIISANAAPPPRNNDSFRKAITFRSLPYSNTQDTSAATFDESEPDPSCPDAGVGHTVWYVFTPDADTTITADTFGSDYDTTLVVFTRSANTFTEVACNDDEPSGALIQSQVSFDVSAHQKYYFMIGAYDGDAAGSLVFNVQ
jgi:hypothetical protein